MEIKQIDKLKIVFEVYKSLYLFPSLKKKISLLFRPFDAPRYTEFAYLKKVLNKDHDLNVLDVSSPHVMAYLLSRNNKVIKTDIDSQEKKYIKESDNFSFKLEDATSLSFASNTFDLVYSVSVIEHIYENYILAIKEMIRVTKGGGLIYITFPVAKEYKEEWKEGEVYEKQYKSKDKTFFQYRFSEKEIHRILEEIKKEDIFILHNDIFWERNEGDYDKMISILKYNFKNSFLNFLKSVLINLYYGFRLFSKKSNNDFIFAKSCGNMHLIIQKNA